MSDVAYHAVIAVVELIIKVIAVVETLQQLLLNQHSNYCMASHMIARDPREDPYDPHITHTHTYTYTDTDTDTSIHPSIHPSSIHMYIITRDLRQDPYESILMVAPQQGRQLVILSFRAQHLTHSYAHAPMHPCRHTGMHTCMHGKVAMSSGRHPGRHPCIIRSSTTPHPHTLAIIMLFSARQHKRPKSSTLNTQP